MFPYPSQLLQSVRNSIMPSQKKNTAVSNTTLDGSQKTYEFANESDDDISDVDLPTRPALRVPQNSRESPSLSVLTSGSNVNVGSLSVTNLEKLKILFVESRKGRVNAHSSEMKTTLSPYANKFDLYCRQCIPGLLLRRFFRSPSDALNDLQLFVIKLDICDAVFFNRWKLWRSVIKATLHTQRGSETGRSTKSTIPKSASTPTNEKRWMDMYSAIRKIMLSNWILFFEYPSTRIFLNALHHNYGSLMKRCADPSDASTYYELEWNRHLEPMCHRHTLVLDLDHTITCVNEGVLLGMLWVQ